ncbi:hypothetical protein U1Q18_045997 [Sarracenia purpurea var. burkii]
MAVLYFGHGHGFLPVEIIGQRPDRQIRVRFFPPEDEEIADVDVDELRPWWYRNFVTVHNRNSRSWNATNDRRRQTDGNDLFRFQLILVEFDAEIIKATNAGNRDVEVFSFAAVTRA